MRRHNHSLEQQQLLISLLQDIIGKLVQIDFDKSDEDQNRIRAHAYLKGQYTVLNQLLADEYPYPEQPNQPEGEV